MSEHGNEGTHICCDTRLKTEGGEARCCVCVPHDNCTLHDPAESVENTSNTLKTDGASLSVEPVVSDECHVTL